MEKRKYRLQLTPNAAQKEALLKRWQGANKENVKIQKRDVQVKETFLHIPEVGNIRHLSRHNNIAGEIEAVELRRDADGECIANIVCWYRSMPDLPLAKESQISISGSDCALDLNGAMVVGEAYQEEGIARLHQLQKELIAMPCGSIEWHKQRKRAAMQQKRLQAKRDQDYQRLIAERESSAETIVVGVLPCVACQQKKG